MMPMTTFPCFPLVGNANVILNFLLKLFLKMWMSDNKLLGLDMNIRISAGLYQQRWRDVMLTGDTAKLS